MQSRTIIDMAIGAIMAQNRCGRDAAFKILRNTSNNRNLKIRDVAAAVVASIAGDTDMSPHASRSRCGDRPAAGRKT